MGFHRRRFIAPTPRRSPGMKTGSNASPGLSTEAGRAPETNDLRAWGRYKGGTRKWEPMEKLWGSSEGQGPMRGTWSGELSRTWNT